MKLSKTLLTSITVQDLPLGDREGILESRSWLDIAVWIQSLPQSKSSVDHHVMEPEDRVVRRVVQVGHVPAATGGTMNHIVN